MLETTALVFGRKFGRHNFSYFISPKKTWEGFVGQFAGIFVGMALIKTMVWLFSIDMMGFTLWDIFLIGLFVAPLTILGDLMESVLKRAVEVKDSSEHNIVGSLGGILDKFDSFGVTWIGVSIIIRLLRPEHYPM